MLLGLRASLTAGVRLTSGRPVNSGRWRLASLLWLAALACHKEAPPGAQPGSRIAVDSSLGVPASDSASRSAARFAQEFYDWYAHQGENAAAALRDRPALFAPVLLAALRGDVAASAKNPDEVVGLDWDPFLNTQDPCNPYRVGQVTRRGDTILVAVKGQCPDTAPHAGPDVIAELGQVSGGWAFLDFRHAADRGSLLQDLATLRQGRDSARSGRPGARTRPD